MRKTHKLTKQQTKALIDFATSVDMEGFGYACENYYIKDDELYDLICKPVNDARVTFMKLCHENDINVEE